MPSVSMAERFLEKLAGGDLDDLLSEGAVSWHNLDGVESPVSPTATANFAAVRAAFPDFRYADVRYTVSEDGVSLARFTLMATLADGSQLRAPGCLVVTEQNGLITRVEEYLDGRHLVPLVEALAAARIGGGQ